MGDNDLCAKNSCLQNVNIVLHIARFRGTVELATTTKSIKTLMSFMNDIFYYNPKLSMSHVSLSFVLVFNERIFYY